MKRIAAVFLALTVMANLGGCEKEASPDAAGPSTQNPATGTAMPSFIQTEDAINAIKSAPVGTDPWQIYYSGREYVYATYNFGVEIIVRYTIRENKIDRALDVRCLHEGIAGPSSTNCFFSTDGTYAFCLAGASSDEKGSGAQEVYKLDFETRNVALSDRDRSALEQFPNEFYKPEAAGLSAEKYRLKREDNPDLPELYDWSTVAQIDEDTFFIICGDDPDKGLPGESYADFKFIVVDVSENKTVQEFRFDSGEQTASYDK